MLNGVGILWTLIIMGVAVTIHELGHYLAARWQGVAVRTFSIGMGRIVFSRHWKGTDWCVSALPLGGYVLIDGMTPQEDEKGELQRPEHGYEALSALGKIAILLAGSLSNLVLAWLLLTVLFVGRGAETGERVRITEVVTGSVAAQYGVQAGDYITLPQKDDYRSLSQTLKTGGEKKLLLWHGTQSQELTFNWAGKGLFGIRYEPELVRIGVGEAAVKSVGTLGQMIPRALQSFGRVGLALLTLDGSKAEDLRGPIGTAQEVSRASAAGVWSLVVMAAMINFSLAVFNLLPVPVLDGGRILLVFVSALIRRPLSMVQEQYFMMVGFFMMMGVTIFVVLKDIGRLFPS